MVGDSTSSMACGCVRIFVIKIVFVIKRVMDLGFFVEWINIVGWLTSVCKLQAGKIYFPVNSGL